MDNLASGLDAFVGGGAENTAGGVRSVVCGGRSNTAEGDLAAVGGGFDNEASGDRAFIGGGFGNVASGLRSTVGGGRGNFCTANDAVIAGGVNQGVFAGQGTVSGGENNFVTADHGTVGGGLSNQVYGASGTVGGGIQNAAAGAGSTVGGGIVSLARGVNSTIGGGFGNLIEMGATSATIVGGENNSIGDAGSFALAAGRRAHADHSGAFVWGDSQDVDKTSSLSDQFNVYASGGTRIFSDSSAANGVSLAPGAGSWTSVSDRDAKQNIERVDPREVLERLASVPVSSWSYKTQDASVRHMGPMAQDFHAAFGLGLGEKGIDTIDADGVALAAIQGLSEKLLEKDGEVAQLTEESADLRQSMESLEEELAALKATVALMAEQN